MGTLTSLLSIKLCDDFSCHSEGNPGFFLAPVVILNLSHLLFWSWLTHLLTIPIMCQQADALGFVLSFYLPAALFDRCHMAQCHLGPYLRHLSWPLAMVWGPHGVGFIEITTSLSRVLHFSLCLLLCLMFLHQLITWHYVLHLLICCLPSKLEYKLWVAQTLYFVSPRARMELNTLQSFTKLLVEWITQS